jgi:hypothetical protein
MAHYAKVLDGKVINVTVAEQDYIDNFVDETPGKWIQCSYNTKGGVHKLGGTPLRKNYPSIGWGYDRELDAFIPPKTYSSWTLNEDTCLWEPPVEKPTDRPTVWNEETQIWDDITED